MIDDQAIAEKLHLPVEHVRQQRMRWNQEDVMRAIISESLERSIRERDAKLRKIEPEELKRCQGEITGLEIALALLSKQQT